MVLGSRRTRTLEYCKRAVIAFTVVILITTLVLFFIFDPDVALLFAMLGVPAIFIVLVIPLILGRLKSSVAEDIKIRELNSIANRFLEVRCKVSEIKREFNVDTDKTEFKLKKVERALKERACFLEDDNIIYDKAKERKARLSEISEIGEEITDITQVVNDLYEALQAKKRFGAQNGAEKSHSITDNVHFTATAPATMRLGNSYTLDVWMHLAEQRQEVIARAIEAQGQEDIRIRSKGPVEVARGTILTVRLSIPDFIVKDSEDTILWDGNIGNASFPITVPTDARIGRHSGEVFFYVSGLQIAKLYFDLEIGHRESSVYQLVTHEQRVRTAFASYASENRDEVLARVQGIMKALPDLDLFLDVMSLRSGEDWEKRLKYEIEKRDIFYLFWSRAASRSHWVEMEWRTALDMKGIEYIDPVPLVSPNVVPPPKELAKLHFNDWMLAYMRGESYEST